MDVPDRPAADSWKIVGQSVPRREDAWLLTGKGCYVDDVPEPPNTLHLGFVLSPRPTPASSRSTLTRRGRCPAC